jgi:hypothetical protein
MAGKREGWIAVNAGGDCHLPGPSAATGLLGPRLRRLGATIALEASLAPSLTTVRFPPSVLRFLVRSDTLMMLDDCSSIFAL